MTEQEIRYLGDVQRLMLRPGDVVVLKVPGQLTVEQQWEVSERLRMTFPERRCLVLMDGVEIGVVVAGDAWPADDAQVYVTPLDMACQCQGSCSAGDYKVE